MAMRPGETPVPIPNTMVKTRAAENTLLETAREDRWLPDIQRKSMEVDLQKLMSKEAYIFVN